MRTALLCALFTLSCTEGLAYPPRLSAIVPSEGANDVDVQVEISGGHLEPRLHTDFEHASRSSWNRAFSAALIPVDATLPKVALAEVELQPDGALKGTVKAGAARGFYGLQVVDAYGREGFVPEVYRVVASPRRVAFFRFAPVGPQRPGVPFTVNVSAVDPEGNVVDGFTSGVEVTDLTGAITPHRIEPFALGKARAQLSVDALTAADILTATDALGRTGSSNAFAVQSGLVVELAFLSPAQSLLVGECSRPVTLEARDTYGFPAQLEAAVEAELAAAPAQALGFFADSACTQAISSVRLQAGASRLTFYLRAGGSGPIVIRVVPPLFPSASQTETVTQ